MRKNNLFKLILVIGMMIPLLNGECEDERDITYKVKIVSAGANCQGYYFYDDSSTVTFQTTNFSVNGSGTFDGTFTNPDDEVHVYAVTTLVAATSLKIYLYKEGSIIKEATGVRIGGNPSYNLEAFLDYTIIPEEETTTGTTTGTGTTGTGTTSGTTY